LSYAPAMEPVKLKEALGSVKRHKKSGQQTPRRWGWGTPLKKRTATRIFHSAVFETFCQ